MQKIQRKISCSHFTTYNTVYKRNLKPWSLFHRSQLFYRHPYRHQSSRKRRHVGTYCGYFYFLQCIVYFKCPGTNSTSGALPGTTIISFLSGQSGCRGQPPRQHHGEHPGQSHGEHPGQPTGQQQGEPPGQQHRQPPGRPRHGENPSG